MFNKSKYTKYYHQITSRAQNREIDTYTENHHIIPESMGGPTTKENLVTLTAREHFICHWLLTKMTTGKDKANMIYALNGMKRKNKYQERYETKITSRVYSRLRKIVAEQHSEFMTGRTAWNKGLKLEGEKYKGGKKNKGRVQSKEQIDNRVEKNTGQKRTQETKDKIAQALTGIIRGPMSQEEKNKRSASTKDKPKSEEFSRHLSMSLKKLAAEGNHHSQVEMSCLHCGKVAKKLSYSRNHGDNCPKSPVYKGPRKYKKKGKVE